MNKIKDIFDVIYGSSFSNIRNYKKGKTPVIKSQGTNNGVFALLDIEPNYINVLTVARTGSVGSCFFQPNPCYVTDDCMVLIPRKNLSPKEMLFYATIIYKENYKYTYSRKVTPKRLKETKIPDINKISLNLNKVSIPKEPTDKSFHNKVVNIQDRNWDWFACASIFDEIVKCKCSSATSLLEKGDDIYYIGAKKTDNGIMEKVSMVDKLVSKGNCIAFIGDGQGSVGYTTYQENDFIGSSTLTCGYNKYLNKFNALFLVNILDLERYKYSFGRKYGKEQVKKCKIKIPVNSDGKPDWQFMEYYIKSLPYSSNLKEIKNIPNKGLSDKEIVAKYEAGSIDLGEKLKSAINKN